MQAMHWRRQMGGRWQVVRVQWNARGCTDDERPMLKRKLARDDVARVLVVDAGSLTHSLAHLLPIVIVTVAHGDHHTSSSVTRARIPARYFPPRLRD